VHFGRIKLFRFVRFILFVGGNTEFCATRELKILDTVPGTTLQISVLHFRAYV